MSLNFHGSFKSVAASLGVSATRLRASHLKNDRQLVDKLAEGMQRADARRSSRQVKDAATAFSTSALSQVLAPIDRASQERFLFVPGRTGDQAPLLPVIQRAALGIRTLEYQVVAQVGEARWLGAGGVADLKRADTVDDQREQNVGWFGVRFGWDQFEIYQAGHLNRPIEIEHQMSGRQAMDELLEDVAGWGNPGRKIPGMFNQGAAVTLDLPKSFVDPTLTAAEMLGQLGTIEAMWSRLNPRRLVSGVVMPRTHRLNMLTVFGGTDSSGPSMWLHAKEMYPWLASIVEDDRLMNGGEEGQGMWQLWSADTEELYLEASPTPMLFGPFEDQMNTDFILLNQTAGVVNKRDERLLRVQMPAV